MSDVGSTEDQQVSRIEGVVLQPLVRHEDVRGVFTETYRESWFGGRPMVQGNRSDSRAGVVRGLHFHQRQSDYWVCVHGRIVVVLHDLRRSSPTYLVTQGIELTGRSDLGVLIPPGVAHGFGAIEDSTLTYLVDNPYDASDEFGIRWDDPQVGFDWPIADPVLSARDAECGLVSDLDPAVLPA